MIEIRGWRISARVNLSIRTDFNSLGNFSKVAGSAMADAPASPPCAVHFLSIHLMTANPRSHYTERMIFRVTSLFFLAILCSCSSKAPRPTSAEVSAVEYVENPKVPRDYKQDTLIKISPNPAKGFNFGYFLYVPAKLETENQPILYVEPNNTGTSNDDLTVHDSYARRFIEKSYSHRIAMRLHSPMLEPIFPRPAGQGQAYTHYLNRDTLKITEGPLKRIDLQLYAMIEDARNLLAQSGIKIRPKIFMNGFSSSAGFTLRFTALHPELIQATAAGGINALPILPLRKCQGFELHYPVGVGDLKELTGSDFDSKTFLKIPQKLYMGALDSNDTVPFRDAWSENEADFISQTFGEKMMPDRWEKIQKIYKSSDANITFSTYSGVGHKVTPEIEEDIFQFFAHHR